jgi:hypothetical protein
MICEELRPVKPRRSSRRRFADWEEPYGVKRWSATWVEAHGQSTVDLHRNDLELTEGLLSVGALPSELEKNIQVRGTLCSQNLIVRRDGGASVTIHSVGRSGDRPGLPHAESAAAARVLAAHPKVLTVLLMLHDSGHCTQEGFEEIGVDRAYLPVLIASLSGNGLIEESRGNLVISEKGRKVVEVVRHRLAEGRQ